MALPISTSISDTDHSISSCITSTRKFCFSYPFILLTASLIRWFFHFPSLKSSTISYRLQMPLRASRPLPIEFRLRISFLHIGGGMLDCLVGLLGGVAWWGCLVGLLGGLHGRRGWEAELQKAVTYTTKSYFVVIVGRGPASFKNLKQFGKILGS